MRAKGVALGWMALMVLAGCSGPPEQEVSARPSSSSTTVTTIEKVQKWALTITVVGPEDRQAARADQVAAAARAAGYSGAYVRPLPRGGCEVSDEAMACATMPVALLVVLEERGERSKPRSKEQHAAQNDWVEQENKRGDAESRARRFSPGPDTLGPSLSRID